MTNLEKLKKKKKELDTFWKKKKNKLHKNLKKTWEFEEIFDSFVKDFWKIKIHIELQTIFQPFPIPDPLIKVYIPKFGDLG